MQTFNRLVPSYERAPQEIMDDLGPAAHELMREALDHSLRHGCYVCRKCLWTTCTDGAFYLLPTACCLYPECRHEPDNRGWRIIVTPLLCEDCGRTVRFAEHMLRTPEMPR